MGSGVDLMRNLRWVECTVPSSSGSELDEDEEELEEWKDWICFGGVWHTSFSASRVFCSLVRSPSNALSPTEHLFSEWCLHEGEDGLGAAGVTGRYFLSHHKQGQTISTSFMELQTGQLPRAFNALH